MREPTESRDGLSRLRDSATARLRDQRGSALAAVLVLVVLLTVAGVAMVNSTFTEISVAYNAGDASAAQYAAEAGLSRAMYELGQNAGWTGITAAIGTGQYVVTVTSSGLIRSITSTGTRGGGRRVLKAAVKVVAKSAASTVLANTTATIGSNTSGLTVSNDYPSSAASAVHANNQLSGPTAISVNTAGANVIGGLTANGVITGVGCPTWAWTCNASAGVRPMPEIDVDSAATSSLKYRAQHTFDADGKYLYFKGGDPGRCNSGSPWIFTSTQQCWDYYVNSKSGTLGSGITNPVFFVEFTGATESTTYTPGGGGSIAFRAISPNGGDVYNGLSNTGNCVHVPTGVANGDVMLAVISWTGGSAYTVTTPANYAMNMTNSDLTVAGADFNKELDVYTGDISIPVSVAANAYKYGYGFTKVGVPGAAGVAGTYLVRISVPTAGANSNIWVSAAVDHVNSAGVVLNTSGFAPTELQGTAGSKEFTFTNPILGTWSAGDRLRISYRFHNLVGTTQSITVGHSVAGWDYQNMVMTPWTNGWTLLRRIDNSTTASMAVYWKAADSNESGRVCQSYNGAGYDWAFTPTSGTKTMVGSISAYSGVNASTPIDVENGLATASSTTHSTPSITTTVANAMVVASFAVNNSNATTNQWTPPAGMTERIDRGPTPAIESAELLQALAGPTGVKTATAVRSGVGAAHILALKPGPGGGTAVQCGGIDYLETLCIRATPASGPGYSSSVLSQVTGAIVTFRRGSGTSVAGDIVFENMALDSTTTHNYTHTNVGSDPALIAAGKITMISSSPPTPARTSTTITGIIYTFAGSDNPDANANLQGASTLGFDLQHGANGITLKLSGLLLSNGSISLLDTGGTGTATIQYNRTVVENLPAAFTAPTVGSFMIPVSWSSGD